MRIDAFNKIGQLYQANSTNKITKSNNRQKLDKVEISQAGKDYQTAKAAVSAVSDIREDKVNAIKQSITSGTYNISGEDLADKLLADYTIK